MGWALRSNQGRKEKRFSEKQKSFLTDRFLIGESTGRKEDAMSVAKAMMTAKDADGHCLFNSTEFLTRKKIAGFFSRLAAKRQLLREDDSDDDETDDDETDGDIDLAENEEVLEDVSLTHPICFDRHNLCDLTKKSKLSNLLIPVLQDICKEFDIPASEFDIPASCLNKVEVEVEVTTISIVTRNATIETTVTTGKSGKTLPNKLLGTSCTLIGSNKNSVNGFARKYS
jgi:Arf-GAP/Rho-GAP domain/ANK repeat/PH domain-containing protein 3